MRLYKQISPILLLTIVLGVMINASNLDTSNFGDNSIAVREGVSHTGSLKKDLEGKIRIANSSLAEIDSTSTKIVQTATREVGNIGGYKFWSWYGFDTKVAWCGCFVSWCAEQNGLIEAGAIPKFAAVSYGEDWFRSRKLWLSGQETPKPGMIVFFDFTNSNLEDYRDGRADHVGIVSAVKDGYVYCVEGNYNDIVASTKYVIGHRNILGYGTPEY